MDVPHIKLSQAEVKLVAVIDEEKRERKLPSDRIFDRSRSAFAMGWLILLACGTVALETGAQPSFSVMARQGDPAPGLSAGHTWSAVWPDPAINNLGTVVFRAGIAGPVVSGCNGIWVGAPGAYELIAHEGQPAPGAGADFKEIEDGYVTEDGYVAFWSFLPDVESETQYGNFVAVTGTLQMVARSGLHPPGTPGDVTYTYTAVPYLASQGKLVFYANYEQPGVLEHKAGLWAGEVGSLSYVMRSLAQAPDAPPGSTFLIGPNGYAINGHGHVLFGGETTGDPGQGIWLFDGSETRLAKASGEGEDADGHPVTFNTFHVYNYRDDGKVTFRSSVEGVGESVWYGILDAPRCLVAEGDTAADLGDGIQFGALDPNRWDETGVVAMRASLTGDGVTADNDTSIWSVAPGRLRFVAREGDLAPGTPGWTFSDFNGSGYNRPIAVNALGQTLFNSRLMTNGVVSSEHDSLWLSGVDGIPHLLACEGALVDLDPGPEEDLHEVVSIYAGWRGLNDHGEAVYYLRFADSLRVIMKATVDPGVPTMNAAPFWLSAETVSLSIADLWPGFTTHVEKCVSLLEASWTNVSTFVPAGSSTNVLVAVDADRGFYRVVINY